jgi:hypothetical protein
MMEHTEQRTFESLANIRAANYNIGHHWFDAGTLRFFGSRVHDELYGGRYFVTSERDSGFGSLGAAWGGARRYTVRVANADGSIDTVGEFGQYASRSGAHAAAARFAMGEVRA